jgi:O-methyltransferase
VQRLRLPQGAFLTWSDGKLRVGQVGRPFTLYEVSLDLAMLLFRFTEPTAGGDVIDGLDVDDGERAVLEQAIEHLMSEGLLVSAEQGATAAVTPGTLKAAEFELGRTVSLYPDIEALDPEFMRAYRACSDYTLTSVPLMYSLYVATQYVARAKIPGDIVECGVWRGGSMMLAAMALRRHGDLSRRLFLYDTYDWSWESPSSRDGVIHGEATPVSSPESDALRCAFAREASETAVKENMVSTGYPADQIITVRGMVQQTIPATSPDQIALLRLDTDYFESTYHEMQHLFPRLVSGGVLIIDDYAKFRGATAAVDQYLAEQGIEVLLHRLDIQGRIAIKP